MRKIMKYSSILMGACILAFGLYNIHARCGISEGGALGLTLLLYHWFHVSPAISSLIIDTSAMLLGACILKNSFLFDSLFAALSYAAFYRIFESFPPLLPDFSEKPLLAAIIGAAFVGIGTSLIVREGSAAGADDSLGLIFHHKTGLNISLFYIISDMTILLLSLSYIPLNRILWSLLTVSLSSGIIAILTGIKKPRE